MSTGKQQFNMRSASKSRPRLSPDITRELQYLDPLIHREWRSRVKAAFQQLDVDERKYAYQRYLAPKGIRVNPESRQLVYGGRPTLPNIKPRLKSPRLKQIYRDLTHSLDSLRNEGDANKYIEIVESTIASIEAFNPEDNLGLQKEKLLLRQAYLDDVIKITQEASLAASQSYRGLTPGIIKDFIVEVFLLQKMQGYRFRTCPPENLQNHSHPFIREIVAVEAQTRQCEVVETERYLYLIGPTRNRNQNPYSASRFMKEETAMNGNAVFLKAMAIPFKSLVNDEIVKHLHWSLNRIVTLERKVSTGIQECIESFKIARRDKLMPLLAEDILADESNFKTVIDQKLAIYEQLLTTYILGRLPIIVTSDAKTHDDHDYLFYHLRALILLLANDVRDFSGKFSASEGETGHRLELRLLSYLCLMEKRRDTIFSLGLLQKPELLEDAQIPSKELKLAVDKIQTKAIQLGSKIASLQDQITKPKGRFQQWWDQRRGTTDKRQAALNKLVIDLEFRKKQCLIELIRICKRHCNLTVHLEFEGLVEVDESQRHYALPMGNNGIGQLPRLIKLSEDESNSEFKEVIAKLGLNSRAA